MLELMAQAGTRDKAALLAELAEEALLGRGHALKVAAMRYSRLGIAGIDRDRQG